MHDMEGLDPLQSFHPKVNLRFAERIPVICPLNEAFIRIHPAQVK